MKFLSLLSASKVVRAGRLHARVVLLLVLSPTFIGAQSGWFPLTLPWDDDSKTTIDASDLLVDFPEQNPAEVIDARGFVRAGSDGHFYFENTRKRARFWGVNFVFNANFPPCPDEPLRSGEYPDRQVSDKLARRLAKLGVNAVRFHHMNFFGSPSGIFDPAFFPNDTQRLDAGQLKRMDYLIYHLRKNGIYVNLNLKVARHFGPGDDLPETESFSGSLAYFQGVSHYNPRMIELQKNYAKQILTHHNPYTGKTYGDDPAVLRAEIANEDSLFANMLNDGGINRGPLLAALLGNLHDWDAIYLFDFAGSSTAFDDDFTSSFFSLTGNPIKSAQLPVASRIFLQGQNSVASENIRVDRTQGDVAQGDIHGLIAGSKLLAGKGLNWVAFLQNHFRIRSFNRAEPAPIEFSVPAGNVTSSNGELTWDRADIQATFLRVRGTAVQGAIGFLKGHSIDLGDWSFQTANDGPEHLAVLMQARDGFPLRESRRMILSVWTEHQNMEWNAGLTPVENRWGRAPALVRPASIDVTLRFQSSGAVRFYPLDEKGFRKEARPEQRVEGGWRFGLDTARDQTVWYEIEMNDASTTADYSSPARGLFQLYSDPANSPLQIGWIDMEHRAGGQPKVTPLLEYRSRGVLASVVKLPIAGSARAALIPVIRDGITNTAIALLNPTGGIFDVSLRLFDQSGNPVGESKVETLEAGKTEAFFVDEKFTFPSKFNGSLELRASVPFVSFALRSMSNAAGDMLFTPYPSASSASTGPLFFTHLVSDDSYSSEIVVLNSQSQPANVLLEFFTSSGEIRSADSMDLELQPGEIRRVLFPRSSPAFSGYARLTLRSGAALPLALGIITRWENGVPISEVGIPATTTLNLDTTVAAERSRQHTALALLNPAADPVSVELELAGSELPPGADKNARIELKAGEKRSFFLREVFPKLPSHFNAILQIKSSAKIAVLSLLGIYNSRGNFLLASLTENKTPSLSGARTIVPRFVTGGGYRTILYLANPSDEKFTGELRFFDALGTPQAVLFR